MRNIKIKNDKEITKMRKACEYAAFVLDTVKNGSKEGVSTYMLDDLAKKTMDSIGAVSASYGYGDKKNAFLGNICISINEEVVHGRGSKNVFLKNGDIVSLDVALYYDGFAGDNTVTIGIGDIDDSKKKLLKITEQSLYKGIDQALEGNRIGDISNAIQKFAEKNGFGVVRELVGHGIGKDMHEEPQVPNVGLANTGCVLKAGMTLAIEPMLTVGSPKIKLLDDGWTIVTADKKPSAHFEHTILITKDSPEILTVVKKFISPK